MGAYEDDSVDIDEGSETDEEGGPSRDRGEKEGMSYRVQATRSIQRARKTLGAEGEPTATTGFLLQSATVWALLELADAVRESRQI